MDPTFDMDVAKNIRPQTHKSFTHFSPRFLLAVLDWRHASKSERQDTDLALYIYTRMHRGRQKRG